MRIAICDDEKNIRELIGNKVAKQYPEAEIVFFQSGVELLLSDKHVDILFLDIQMSGRDGMETARELRKKDKSVILIFVTAVEEYVFQAFDVGAFNYIVKPIDDTKFVDVLCRAVDEWHSQDTNVREPEANYVMINNGGVHTKVIIEDIVYAEVFNRKVVIHKLDDEIEYYGKMSDLEAVAGDSFFRPHRAYLVNFKYVEKYDATTIYLVWLPSRSRLIFASVVLIWAGGVGNMIDRIFRGYVIDFINLSFVDFFVFNFADCCVVIGCGLLLLYLILDTVREIRQKGEHHADHPADRDA